jgi:hypothetical protein
MILPLILFIDPASWSVVEQRSHLLLNMEFLGKGFDNHGIKSKTSSNAYNKGQGKPQGD